VTVIAQFSNWQTGLPPIVQRLGIMPRLRDVQEWGFCRGGAQMALDGDLCCPLEAVGLVLGHPYRDPDQPHRPFARIIPSRLSNAAPLRLLSLCLNKVFSTFRPFLGFVAQIP
jgi:hypothetical protein